MDQKENLFKNPWVAIGLPALTLLLGIQILKALFPLLLYVLGDRFGWPAINIGALALILALVSFLASFLRKFIGARVLLIVSVLGVGLTRLAFQLWPDNAVAYLLLCFVGTICLAFFFPVYLATIRTQGAEEMGNFGFGIQVGLILTILFSGMFNTYELTWQSGFFSSLLVIILVFLQAGCLAGMLSNLPTAVNNDQDAVSFKQALPWAVIGPFLFLQMLLFSNIAQIAAATGWDLPLAFALAMAGAVAGFLGAGAVYWRGTNRLELIGGGVVLLIVLFIVSTSPEYIAVLYLIGPLMLAEWLMVVLMNIEQGNGRNNSSRNLTVSNGIGWVLFMVLIFLFYAGYDLPLPFPNSLITNFAFLLCFLAGLMAMLAFPATTIAHKLPLTHSLGLAAVILIALVGFKYLTWQTPEPVAATGQPLRIMTYNLHNGVNPQGQLDLEALAQTIEAENPDVVALQEVSRGWIINGSTDMLQWLAQRLDMPYVWGATEGDNWGNAIFSRYPIADETSLALPPEDLLLHRGAILANIDTGSGEALNIIDTHYHHLDDGSDIRVEQTQALLDFWQSRPSTILMGDLNATPNTPEMQMLEDAGFIEGLAAAGIIPAYTYSSIDPNRQLDYIWYTPDLTATNMVILSSQASDHLGIAATLSGN